MDPGIDDEAGGPERVPLEHAEPLGVIGAQVDLVRKALGIEAPEPSQKAPPTRSAANRSTSGRVAVPSSIQA